VLGGDLVGCEVVVAPRVRPADVVEEQQRQARALRALTDDPQLLGHRVVVVVAVDDRGVGQRDRPQRLVARGPDELEIRALLVEGDELLLGRRIDRPDACLGARGPLQQQPREIAGVRADLDHGPRPGRVEARDQQLRVVEQRRAPAPGLVGVGIEVQIEPVHEGAAVYRRVSPV
jgi:hypothetical protein